MILSLNADELYAKYKIYDPGHLHARCAEVNHTEYVIQDITPQQSLSLLVGDSGLGKSPLLYQAGMCVAAGVPFLGFGVRQGRVLYVDAENGIADVQRIQTRLARHLGLGAPPDGLFLLNVNDCSDQFGTSGHRLEDVLRDLRPDLAIIDPIYAIYSDIEHDSRCATEAYRQMRALMRELGFSAMGVHHLRKPASDATPEGLETCAHVRDWFLQARGSGAMINGCDVRIGIDHAKQHNSAQLVVRGFGRVRGELPKIHLTRRLDPADGEPIGYDRITGMELLKEQDQEAYCRLDDEFRFSEAQAAYGKGAEAAKLFLKRCTDANAVEKLPACGYRKLSPGRGPE